MRSSKQFFGYLRLATVCTLLTGQMSSALADIEPDDFKGVYVMESCTGRNSFVSLPSDDFSSESIVTTIETDPSGKAISIKNNPIYLKEAGRWDIPIYLPDAPPTKTKKGKPNPNLKVTVDESTISNEYYSGVDKGMVIFASAWPLAQVMLPKILKDRSRFRISLTKVPADEKYSEGITLKYEDLDLKTKESKSSTVCRLTKSESLAAAKKEENSRVAKLKWKRMSPEQQEAMRDQVTTPKEPENKAQLPGTEQADPTGAQ